MGKKEEKKGAKKGPGGHPCKGRETLSKRETISSTEREFEKAGKMIGGRTSMKR